MKKLILIGLMCGLFFVVPSFAQSTPGGAIQFRSVRTELATRPRGGVVNFFEPSIGTNPVQSSNQDQWFWSVVSPARSDANASRLRNAAEHAAGHRPYRADPAALRRIAGQYRTELAAAEASTGVSASLLLAIIYVESRGRSDAVSSAGAMGLMQLMPGTAAGLGVTDAFNPRQNIQGGATYIDTMLGMFAGDAVLSLAGYNAGPGSVTERGQVPPFRETRGYVPKVLSAWHVARDLCLVRPQGPTDPCQFSATSSAD